MENSFEKFLKNSQKFFDEVGATPEEREMYLRSVTEDRLKKYTERVTKKYPLSVNKKAMEYWNSLSPLEQSETTMEEACFKMLEEDQNSLNASEVRSLFREDGSLKPLTLDPFEAPIRDVDRGQWEVGNLVEQPLEKPVREVRVPTPLEARGMSAEKLRKFIPKQNEEE